MFIEIIFQYKTDYYLFIFKNVLSLIKLVLYFPRKMFVKKRLADYKNTLFANCLQIWKNGQKMRVGIKSVLQSGI